MVKIENFSSNMINPNQRQELENRKRINIKMSRATNSGRLQHDFHVREQWQETNAKILDSYDSFYRTTKALLVLFQIMGVVPISRKKRNVAGHRTEFTWTSREALWAYFIFGLETLIVAPVGYFRFKDLFVSNDQRFDIIINRVIFLTLLLVHFLLPFASWRNGSAVAEFKNMWTRFQSKYVRVTGEPIHFKNHTVLTWTLCVLSWLMSILFVLAEFYLQEDLHFWHTFAYYHIIATLNCFCSLWYINGEAFTYTSQNLIKHLDKAFATQQKAIKIAEYRHLWIDLSQMIRQLGRLGTIYRQTRLKYSCTLSAKVNASIYSLYLIVIFFTTIIASYGALSEIIDHGLTWKELGLILLVVYCLTILFVICNEAHNATTQVGHNFQERLFNVNLFEVTEPVKKEIEMFLVAIQKNAPVMNLNGYVTVDRRLITSVRQMSHGSLIKL